MSILKTSVKMAFHLKRLLVLLLVALTLSSGTVTTRLGLNDIILLEY